VKVRVGINLLCRLLGLPRSALSIEKGHTSRLKTLPVTGLSPEALKERLRKL